MWGVSLGLNMAVFRRLNAEMSYIVSLNCNSYKAGQDFAPTTTPNSDVAWSRKKPGDFEPLEVTKDKI